MGADLLLLGTGIVLLAFGTVATDVEATVDSRSAREAGSKSAIHCLGPRPSATNRQLLLSVASLLLMVEAQVVVLDV